MLNNRRVERVIWALVTALFLLSLASCGAASAPDAPSPALEPDDETPLSITDDLGRTVFVPRNPMRVAALLGSFADVWLLAGGTLSAAADDAWSVLGLPLGEEVRNLGGVLHINLEELLAAEPDLVLASCDNNTDMELLPTLEALRVPALYFRVEDFTDYLRMLDACTQITGKPENYTRYGLDVRKQADAALSMRDGSAPSVLVLRSGGTSCKAKGSEGTVLGEMLRDLGCRNIADGNNSILEDLSMEAILEKDPDFIFIVYQGSDTAGAEKTLRETLRTNPAWDTLRAVREGRCFTLDRRLYHFKPNAQWGIAYERLARILYGESD